MNNLSSGSFVRDQQAPTGAHIAGRTTLILAAWMAILLLSKLPLVIARDFFGGDIPWITQGWIVAAFLLFASTFVWRALAPLRGFFAVMAVILLVTTAFNPWVSQLAAWQDLFTGSSPLVAVFGDRVLITIDTLIVLAVLYIMGLRRRDAFLTAGDLNAPAGELRFSGRKKRLNWILFGAIITVLLAVLFFALLAAMNPITPAGFASAIPWLPLVLLSAALNAFGEEAIYRAAPLAVLLPAVGARHALWMTAVWFGLGHYYGGIPSGPVGALGSGLLGLLLGKAMLDTRGIVWPWIIHAAIDTAIYLAIAIASAL